MWGRGAAQTYLAVEAGKKSRSRSQDLEELRLYLSACDGGEDHRSELHLPLQLWGEDHRSELHLPLQLYSQDLPLRASHWHDLPEGAAGSREAPFPAERVYAQTLESA